MRLAQQRSSPLHEAVQLCLNQVHDGNVEAVVSCVCGMLATGLGLPTLTGCAKAIVTLSHSQPPDSLRPHAKKILSTLHTGLKEAASPTLRKLYASALAHILKNCAKKAQIAKGKQHASVLIYILFRSLISFPIVSSSCLHSPRVGQ